MIAPWTGRRLAVLAASGLFWMACSTRAKGVPAAIPDASCATSLDANAGHQDAAAALTATLASCKAYCERTIERGCTEYPSVEMCASVYCENSAMFPDDCLTSAKAYFDCGQGLTDICPGINAGCPAEGKAYDDCVFAPRCDEGGFHRPTGGCTDPNDGTCYSCPVEYLCDPVTYRFRCPAGTEPAPWHRCPSEAVPSTAGATKETVTASCNAYCERLATTTCETPAYPTLEACKSIQCGSPIDDICLPSAQAFYDCGRTRADVCQGVAVVCPVQLTIYEDCQSGKGTLTCPSPEPSRGCIGPGDHDLIGYVCDTLRGVWHCPEGTSPTQ